MSKIFKRVFYLILSILLAITLTSCGSIISKNFIPIADAGSDQQVSVGSTVYLYGLAYDKDDRYVYGKWTIIKKPYGSNATLSDDEAQDPYFIADVLGTYVIQLVVYDGKNYSKPDTVTITAVKYGEAYFDNVRVDSITANSATITWKSYAFMTSQIEYGTTKSYGNLSDLDPQLVKEHCVVLNNLVPGTLYHFRIRSKDYEGNEQISIDFTFSTEINSIDLNTQVEHIVYNPSTNEAYAIDVINYNLLVINLTSNQITDSIPLPDKPADLCFDSTGNRVFVIGYGPNISVIDIQTKTKTHDLPWSGPVETSYYVEHSHICYQDGYLYFTDAAWDPKLYKMDLNTSAISDTGLKSVGGMVFNQDGSNFYYWWLYNGNAGTNVFKYTSSFEKLAQTDINYSGGLYNSPLNAPIILVESQNRLFCKRGVFDLSLNLVHMFPENEAILAVAPDYSTIAGRNNIYNPITYAQVRTMPKNNVNIAFYSSNGTLYFTRYSDEKLYYINPSQLTTISINMSPYYKKASIWIRK